MENNLPTKPRVLYTWTVSFFLVMIAVWFLHEAAHGFGFMLEGTHVSTGFNLVGASGKVPSDPNFDLNIPVTGLTLGVLLGPLTTWVLAIIFTAILLRRTIPNQSSLLIGVAAVASAMMRLIPMAIFFIALILGNISGVFQDEQVMALGTIEIIELPISRAELRNLLESDPSIFINDIGFYFWSLVSFGISLTCLVITYRYLFKIFNLHLQERWRRIVFGLMPLIMYIPIFGVVSFLDTFIRINW